MSTPTSSSESHDPVGAVWTTRKLLDWIASRLAEHEVESPRVCAELLISAALGCDRLRLYMEPERVASAQERDMLRDWVRRASAQEPVQYLVGETWFHGRPFEVDRSTLIPRPATETLVECAIDLIREVDGARMIEIGTGTGCVTAAILDGLDRPSRAEARRKAAAIADQLPFQAGEVPEVPTDPAEVNPATAVAIELVPEAAELARRNLQRHGFDSRVEIRVGSLFEPLMAEDHGTFDLLVSNPPYISDAEWEKCDANVREFEPEVALRGGQDGLDLIRSLIAGASKVLKQGGWLALEIQYDQAGVITALLEEAGLSFVAVHQDHEAHDRVIIARRS